MSDPPGTVLVAPYEYTINTDQETWDRLKANVPKAHDMWGHTDHQKMAIAVEPGMGYDALADTVLHEVLHCVLAQGQGLQHLSSVDDVEEYVIERMVPRLLGVLRDNPRLVDWLAGR